MHFHLQMSDLSALRRLIRTCFDISGGALQKAQHDSHWRLHAERISGTSRDYQFAFTAFFWLVLRTPSLKPLLRESVQQQGTVALLLHGM
jgi:hypothetical protein